MYVCLVQTALLLAAIIIIVGEECGAVSLAAQFKDSVASSGLVVSKCGICVKPVVSIQRELNWKSTLMYIACSFHLKPEFKDMFYGWNPSLTRLLLIFLSYF